ncbi:hypothetical protein GOBAR_AA18979 [Gossypium barbadense]|uniref:Uncharacterized protein n=1 Tax=Gossypium barbadense TaxID=3634 RepID=A0A2P5XEF1_GOSBA|nr:hypothetical protein GOBAR_AA18979 [Gossypium barbadense]
MANPITQMIGTKITNVSINSYEALKRQKYVLDIVLPEPFPLLGAAFGAIAFEPELENPKNLSVLEKMMTRTLASQRMANSFDEFNQRSLHHC